MTERYRIVPYGARDWRVQRKGDWLWWDCKRWHEIGSYVTRLFKTEGDAERWMDEQLAIAREREADEELAEHRRRTIPPREYPAK